MALELGDAVFDGFDVVAIGTDRIVAGLLGNDPKLPHDLLRLAIDMREDALELLVHGREPFVHLGTQLLKVRLGCRWLGIVCHLWRSV